MFELGCFCIFRFDMFACHSEVINAGEVGYTKQFVHTLQRQLCDMSGLSTHSQSGKEFGNVPPLSREGILPVLPW